MAVYFRRKDILRLANDCIGRYVYEVDKNADLEFYSRKILGARTIEVFEHMCKVFLMWYYRKKKGRPRL